MSTEVRVSSLPPCDFCDMDDVSTPAAYDAKTNRGPWANMCQLHFQAHAASQTLGTGRGQRLLLREGS